MEHILTVDGQKLTVNVVGSRFHTVFQSLGEVEYDRLLWSLFTREHIKNLLFGVPVGNDATGEMKYLICDLMDLAADDRLTMFVRKERPPIRVTSDLDWLTFHAFIGLAIQDKLPFESKKLKAAKESLKGKRPTSKKEVLAAWEYQG